MWGKDIGIEGGIGGKKRMGMEVAKVESKMVLLREMMRRSGFRDNGCGLTGAVGLDM